MLTTRHALFATLRNVPSRRSYSIVAATSLKGRSGRTYEETGALVTRYEYCRRPDPSGKTPEQEEWCLNLRPITVPGIREIRQGSETFILKSISKANVATRLRQGEELEGSKRLYLPVDSIEKTEEAEDGLVYPCFNTTLDALIEHNPELRTKERIKIMKALAEGLHELHSKGWLHKRLSPHNVHMNVSSDPEDKITVSDVQIGGFDPAFLFDHDPDPPGPYDWEAWLSPEVQVQTGGSNASDMFSLGLLFLHTLNGGYLYQNPPDRIEYNTPSGIVLQQFILLGPVPEELLASITDETGDYPYWFRHLAKEADYVAKKYPRERFRAVAEDHGIPEDATDLMMGMLNLAMSKRLTTKEVLGHEVWRESWRVGEGQ